MSNGALRIHFLNVGHGDCTIIEHPSGRLTVIDINNGEYIDYDSYKEIKETYAPAVSQGLLAAALGGSSARSLSSAGIAADPPPSMSFSKHFLMLMRAAQNCAALLIGNCVLLGREQSGDGDGRSNFHTRV